MTKPLPQFGRGFLYALFCVDFALLFFEGRQMSSKHYSYQIQRGFTLIEIMVVIIIIGVLAALIVPKVMSRPDEARATAARTDISSILQALNLYKLDNHRYPSTEQGLQALVKKPTISPIPENWKGNGYLERVPKDPWGHPFQYLQPGLHGEIDVSSLGADGERGGEGSDADIGSWDQ
jgi:general secretion pathway protein G